jgi:hypothetical protein
MLSCLKRVKMRTKINNANVHGTAPQNNPVTTAGYPKGHESKPGEDTRAVKGGVGM